MKAATSSATFGETNETDNTSYADLRVTGAEMDVLERGQGMSPWDPAKAAASDGRPESPNCPALTTQRNC